MHAISLGTVQVCVVRSLSFLLCCHTGVWIISSLMASRADSKSPEARLKHHNCLGLNSRQNKNKSDSTLFSWSSLKSLTWLYRKGVFIFFSFQSISAELGHDFLCHPGFCWDMEVKELWNVMGKGKITGEQGLWQVFAYVEALRWIPNLDRKTIIS